MKRNKLWWLVGFLAISLTSLLILQTQSLFKSAELKIDQFQHRVTLALCSAVNELSANKEVCSALSSCSVTKTAGLLELVGVQRSEEIEGVVKEKFQFYAINTPYNVNISTTDIGFPSKSNYNTSRIPNVDNAMISVDFPSRQEFILSELNGMFAISLFLVIIIVVICGTALKWLFEQQKIHRNTLDFVDAISHELKTPINNLSLALTMLEKKLPDELPDKFNYYLNVAKTENEALSKKINYVLGTNSLKSILGGQKTVVLNMHDLIKEAIERISVKIDELGGKIELNLLADNCQVQGDNDQILNVMICLIDNAITYTENRPLVYISTTNEHRYVSIHVKDNGIGIPDEMHRQVFEKYYRHGDAGPGHGVGLFLVKKILHNHKGSISLDSQPGQGSEFTMTLPISR